LAVLGGLLISVSSLAVVPSVHAACVNEAIRIEQHATALPQCRAWEMVSPQDKNGTDVSANGLSTIAARDGDAVVFDSRAAFADTIGSGVSGHTQYLARRAAGGWASHAITPTPQPEALQSLYADTKLQTYSEDLDTAILWAYDLPAATDDTPYRNSIYTENTASGSLRTITVSQADPLEPFDFLNQVVWGISADARHLAFVTSTRLLPEAAPGVPNVYLSDDGTISLAGVLPDGSVPPGGSEVAPKNYRAAMSADGTRQLFISPAAGNSQLYQRINGERTVWISRPEGTETSTPTEVHLQAATPDGRTVFFATDSPLLDSDTNSGPDLYRYTDSPDPAHESNLTLVSHGGSFSFSDGVYGVIGASDDGDTVYYSETNGSLFVWHEGVQSLISSEILDTPALGQQLSATAWGPGWARVSADGDYLAFLSHRFGDAEPEPPVEMYLYSLATDRLLCVSCPPAGAGTSARVIPELTSGMLSITDLTARPRFLSDDGLLFFSTAESLLPADINGVLDAYSYDPASGTLALLSSGRGSEPTAFLDASASGGDVFLATRGALLSSDSDQLIDVYDARVGGGFPSPPPPAPDCLGERCRPDPIPPPAMRPIASAESTAGNLSRPNARRRGCARRRHPRRRSRCARRHSNHRAPPELHRITP
jgi:hypothetical protein